MRRMALDVLDRQRPYIGSDLERSGGLSGGPVLSGRVLRAQGRRARDTIELAAGPPASPNGNGHATGTATPRRPGGSPAERRPRRLSDCCTTGSRTPSTTHGAYPSPHGTSTEHLDVLRQAWRPVGAERRSCIRALTGDSDDPVPVLITFDDGYADNLHAALPLLEKFEAPAVLFAASGYLGEQRGFWWDELLTLLVSPTACPTNVISSSGVVFRISWSARPAPPLEARGVHGTRPRPVGPPSIELSGSGCARSCMRSGWRLWMRSLGGPGVERGAQLL